MGLVVGPKHIPGQDAQFVQIGDTAFNPALVTEVRFYSTFVAVFLVGDDMLFMDDDYHAFMRWWENVASVYVAG